MGGCRNRNDIYLLVAFRFVGVKFPDDRFDCVEAAANNESDIDDDGADVANSALFATASMAANWRSSKHMESLLGDTIAGRLATGEDDFGEEFGRRD